MPFINPMFPMRLELLSILRRRHSFPMRHPILEHPSVRNRPVKVHDFPLSLFLVVLVVSLVSQTWFIVVNPETVLLALYELPLKCAFRVCVTAWIIIKKYLYRGTVRFSWICLWTRAIDHFRAISSSPQPCVHSHKHLQKNTFWAPLFPFPCHRTDCS